MLNNSGQTDSFMKSTCLVALADRQLTVTLAFSHLTNAFIPNDLLTVHILSAACEGLEEIGRASCRARV